MTDFQQKAQQARSAAEQQIKNIQANRDLTPQAKERQITEIRNKANHAITEAREAAQGARQEARNSALSKLFGMSFRLSVSEAEKIALRTSYRDAIFRAASMGDPKEAHLLLDRAKLTGDTLLTKAVGLISFEKGWHEVVETYVGTSPDLSDALGELRKADRGANREDQFRESVVFSQIPETDQERAARMAPQVQQSAA